MILSSSSILKYRNFIFGMNESVGIGIYIIHIYIPILHFLEEKLMVRADYLIKPSKIIFEIFTFLSNLNSNLESTRKAV